MKTRPLAHWVQATRQIPQRFVGVKAQHGADTFHGWRTPCKCSASLMSDISRPLPQDAAVGAAPAATLALGLGVITATLLASHEVLPARARSIA